MQKSKHDVWVGIFVMLGAAAIVFLPPLLGLLRTWSWQGALTAFFWGTVAVGLLSSLLQAVSATLSPSTARESGCNFICTSPCESRFAVYDRCLKAPPI